MKKRFWFKKVAGFIVIAVAAVAIFGFVVMTLWNQVLAQVIDVRTISFGQALGIFVLSKILFGGFHGRGGWRGKGPWNRQMRDKWQTMTPEEQQKFKQEWRNRCGRWGAQRKETNADEQNASGNP